MIALIFFQRTLRGIFLVPILFTESWRTLWQRSFFVPRKPIAAHKKETAPETFVPVTVNGKAEADYCESYTSI
jgi:hypothetical protein